MNHRSCTGTPLTLTTAYLIRIFFQYILNLKNFCQCIYLCINLHRPFLQKSQWQILVSGKGLLPGNTFLAATDSALNDPQKRAALQDYLQRLAGAERWAYANLDSYGKTLGEIIRFPAEIARAQFANRQSQWQPLAEETVAQQQATADFYLANGLIRTRLDVKPTFDRRFSVPAAEVTP